MSKEPKEGPVQRLTFYPFAYALFTDELASYCWYCLAAQETKRHCTGCGFALFCNKDCQVLGWKDHKAECKGFKGAKAIPDIETRLLGRIVLRYKTIYAGKDQEDPNFYKDRTSKRQILDIWSHCDQMTKDPVALKKFEEIYSSLVDFYEQKFMLTRDTIWQLHCRDYINRHAICDKGYRREIGKGLYLDLCQYDHSCRPNTIYTCDGFVATLRALGPKVNLLDLKNTHYTYIDLLNPVQQRRKLLRDTWYFTCECERCVDNNDHLLSAIFCPNCPMDDQATVCIFGNHPYKDKETLKITCPKCEKHVPNEYVAFAIETMRSVDAVFENDVLANMKTKKEQLDFLNELFHKYARVFPPTNVFLGRLIQGIIQRVDGHEDLLRLHLASEPCVRLSFPKNHPAVAFHVRNIGIFLSNLGQNEMAIPYFEEAGNMLSFVLGPDHSLTKENRDLMEEAIAKIKDSEKREKFAQMSSYQKQRALEDELKILRIARSREEKKEKKAEKAKEEEKTNTQPIKPSADSKEDFDDLPELVAE